MGVRLRTCDVAILHLYVNHACGWLRLTTGYRGLCLWGQCYDRRLRIVDSSEFQLLDVLNAHFQNIFGISKVQSTLLQLAYFGAYMVYAPIAGIFVSTTSIGISSTSN
jgi:hypothetical protein